ncbi:MAG: peptide chain release factor N(5)-glutamine methyltransferase [Dehalococcoidia bacterium]
MTVQAALRRGTHLLALAGSDEANLEAELLLAHALGLDRVHLYQSLRDPIPPEGKAAYLSLLERRTAHEPTAYLLGHKEFYGLEFEVTPAALIPRPETEVLVELVIAFAGERFAGEPFLLVDAGVGAGVIAVAIARELPQVRVIATDVSAEALALAQRNAESHGLGQRIRFLQGDLLEPLDTRAEIIAANLPYVPTATLERQPPEIREHEPREALDGGPDGLRLIDRLLRQAPQHLKAGGTLYAEIGDEQGEAALALAREAFPEAAVEIKPDLSGLDRVLVVRS